MKRTLAILATAVISSVAWAEYTIDNAAMWLIFDQAGKWTSSSENVSPGNAGVAWSLNIGRDLRNSNNYPVATIAVTIDLSQLVTPTTNTSLFHLNVGNSGAVTLGMGLTTGRRVAAEWDGTVPWASNDSHVFGTALGSEGLVTLIFSTSGSGSSFSIEGQQFNDNYNAWSWSGSPWLFQYCC